MFLKTVYKASRHKFWFKRNETPIRLIGGLAPDRTACAADWRIANLAIHSIFIEAPPVKASMSGTVFGVSAVNYAGDPPKQSFASRSAPAIVGNLVKGIGVDVIHVAIQGQNIPAILAMKTSNSL